MKKTKKKTEYRIAIRWGSRGAGFRPVRKYKFDTKAELDAFMHGLDEGVGWHGYNIVKGSRVNHIPGSREVPRTQKDPAAFAYP
jgi:hypothetical protein